MLRPTEPLSTRERMAWDSILAGEKLAQTAARIGVSVSGARRLRGRVLDKFGAPDLVRLLVMVIQDLRERKL